jgi:hypothetical protein
MFIRPCVSDPAIGHLWTDDPPTLTVCAPQQTTRSLATRTDRLCAACVRAFGADVAAHFPGMEWLRYLPRGRTRHAFDSQDEVEGRDLVPVCVYFRVSRECLVSDEDAMRCPHCVAILRARSYRRAPVPA